ncbi:hypothetical protein D3C72_1841320 [compost metagenome]
MDVIARAAPGVDFPHQVEQARIHLGRLVATPVAQEPVDLLQPLRIIATVALVGDLRLFLRMDEIELERARLAGGLDGRRHAGRDQRHRKGDGCQNLRHLTGHRRAESAS